MILIILPGVIRVDVKLLNTRYRAEFLRLCEAIRNAVYRGS